MQINSYFTNKTDVRSLILENLDKAESSVSVAVAWFTDTTLFRKLVELQEKGVNVELIITNHIFNKQSPNNYSIIEKNGGFFAEIGNDDKYMHMKYCVIDFDIVISGSANWTNKAFREHNEEITIASGHFNRANDFLEEFERLKLLSGKVKTIEKELNVAKAIKVLDLIVALINNGDTDLIQRYIQELKNIPELKSITTDLMGGEFDSAIKQIQKFKTDYTQLVAVTEYEKLHLEAQIRLISYQIELLYFQKVEMETVIDQFNHYYALELNPLLIKIITLKKKIYEKLRKYNVFDDTYEELENEFKQKQQEYEDELRNNIFDLDEEEIKSIKQMHREAATLCHPDSLNCVFEDKEEAADAFNKLTNAYKANDIDGVRRILNELKTNKRVSDSLDFDELHQYRIKLESLKQKYNTLINEIQEITSSEVYQLIKSIPDWDLFFKLKKEELQVQYDELYTKYVGHE
jgi:HPt (histidine-containing phosphotransfer) domain-containing protein